MFGQLSEKIIVGVLTALTLGAIYAAWDAIKRSSMEIFIPSTAVVAFDADECPEGWDIHRDASARFIIGSGDHVNKDQNGNDLSVYKTAETGGEEEHQLTIAELPSHAHEFVGDTVNAGGWAGAITYDIGVGGATAHRSYKPTGTVNPTGGDEAHNNMPPYLALLYCVKE